nr:protein FAM163A [Vicugna pacos]
MTAGTVVITGGILATVILLCIIAVLCYCRLQVSPLGLRPEATSKPPPHGGGRTWRPTEGAEEEEHDLCAHPRGPTCNACSSQALDGRGSLEPLTIEPCGQPCGVAASRCATCSPPYSSPFYIRTADMVPNGGGGERLSFAPMYYKEGGPPFLKVAAPQSYPVTWPGSGREAFTNPRAISTDV